MEQYPVPYQVAMIQMASDFLNRKENLAKAEGYIRTAAANGAKLICLPESFDVGYISTRIPEMMAAAENEQGETVLFMKALAKELGVHILAPAFWKSQDGAVENRAYLIDDEGTLLGSYAKTHPVGDERTLLQRGTQYPVFDTKLGKIGITYLKILVSFNQFCR